MYRCSIFLIFVSKVSSFFVSSTIVSERIFFKPSINIGITFFRFYNETTPQQFEFEIYHLLQISALFLKVLSYKGVIQTKVIFSCGAVKRV